MASSDALPIPQKNVAYRVTFPIFNADGDLVTGATGLDSEVSKDAGTFTDCTNEATEIATASGMYYLDLTSTEMNADTVAIIVKTSSSGAKTTPIVLYPQEAGDIRVNATYVGGTAQTGRDIGASVLLSAGTGTGQLDFTSGVVKANLAQILGTALTETAGQIAAGFKQFFNIASPTSTMNTITTVTTTTTATNLTNAPTAGDLTATMKTSVTTAASAATPAVTVSDKTGFSLSAAGILAIWHQLTSAIVTSSTIGKLLVDNIDAAISSRSTYAGGDTAGTTTLLSRLSATRAGYLDNLSGGAVALASTVLKYFQLALRKDSAIATDNATELTAINANGGSGGGVYVNTTDSQEAVRDRGDAAWITATGFSTLDAAGVRSAIGLASPNLDTQLTAIDDYLDTEVAAIKAKTDLIPASPAAVSDIPTAAVVADAVWDEAIAGHSGAGSAGLALQSAAAPSAAAVADAVWDEILSGHVVSGSTGEALGAAGGAGDPWITALPGAYSAGQAGYILANRASQTSVDAVDDYVDTEIAAIKTQTDKMVFTVANQLDVNVIDWKSVTAPAMTGDAFARLGAPVGASISADLAAVQADTDNIQTRLPAALTGGRMDASVGAYQSGLTPLQPTTAGRTLDVSTTGEAGLDFDNIKDASGAHTLTNITVPVVTTTATATNLTNAPTAGDFTATMKTSLNNATPAVTVSDKTGFSLSSGGVQAIWDALTSALTTPGSIGKWIVDKLDVILSTRLATSAYTTPPTVTQIRTEMDSNSTKLANLDATTSSRATPAQVNAEVVDALATDTYAEPASVPAATASIAAKIGWLMALARNKLTQSATTQTLRNDADSGNIGTSAVSDDDTTYTRSEWQ